MGCGGSSASRSSSLASLTAPADHHASSDNLRKQVLKKQHEADADSLNSSGPPRSPRPGSRSTCRDSGIDSAKTADGRRHPPPDVVHNDNERLIPNGHKMEENHNETEEHDEHEDLRGGVAFEVAVHENKDSIIKKHPPKRLQMFDPAAKPPSLTAEMLAEKQRLTEERRQQELMNRGKSSKKTSRRRKELLAAKEFVNQEQQQHHQQKLDDKISSADRNREKRQAEIKAKQKQRELRAQRAREKIKRLDDVEGEEMNFDMENDDTFNAEDDLDSWLDGENGSRTVYGSAATTKSERIYDGRSSPSKRFQPLTSAEARRKEAGLSSAVSDEITNNNRWAEDKDEFFDS
ncbi:uncharacterized protein [Amphiura filiformis]|uniref:uncharacterized protein n=1 Tax=Amphiura filiformis TaxID=82378 RepID=UPI003B21ECB9